MSQESYGRYDETPMQARAGSIGAGRLDVPKMPETRASNLADRINECERKIEQIQASLNKMYEELTSSCANLQNQIHEINQFIGRRG